MAADRSTSDREELRREDAEFAARVGDKLRDSVDELDAGTLSRLNRARQEALEHVAPASHRTRRMQSWLPAAAVAVLAIVAVTLWWGQTPEIGVDESAIMAGEVLDIEMLLDEGDLEMYEELEFFVWLPEDELENIG